MKKRIVIDSMIQDSLKLGKLNKLPEATMVLQAAMCMNELNRGNGTDDYYTNSKAIRSAIEDLKAMTNYRMLQELIREVV